MLYPGAAMLPGFDVVINEFRCVISSSLALVSLIPT